MRIRVFLLAVFACGAASIQAQPALAKAELILPAKTAQAGATVKAIVRLSIPPGYHAYQNPPSKDYMIPVKVSMLSKDCVLKEATYPVGKEVKLPGEADPIRVYEDRLDIPVKIVVPQKTGQAVIKINVNYQLCVGGECYPPEDSTATAKISVTTVKK